MIREQNMVVNRRGGVGQSLWVFEVLVSGNDDGSAVISEPLRIYIVTCVQVGNRYIY